MDGKYHVSVEQKIPLNTERDNVTPGYLQTLHTIVADKMFEFITSEDAVKPWARTAVETGKLSEEATKHIAKPRFGDNAVLYDHSDIALIHELTHHKVQSNDHLCRDFYDTVTNLGAKLAQLTLEQPELFPDEQEAHEALAA